MTRIASMVARPLGTVFADVASSLRPRWFLVLLAVTVAVGASAFATARQRPLYRASASLVVAPMTLVDDPADILRCLETLEHRSIITTFARIPGSPEAGRAVAGQLGLPNVDGWRIEGSVLPNTNILRIDVEGPDPALAAQAANAVAETARRQARALYRVFTMKILAAATPPTRPALPDWPRNLLVATATGVLLGLLAAYSPSGRARTRSAPEGGLGIAARALLVTLAAAALGWSAAAHPELLAVDVPFSGTLVLALLCGVLASAAILAVPAAGLSLLAAFVYLNLSQVLVRYHGLPSLLQLLAVPLLVSAWRATSPDDRGRALVHPVVVLLAGYTAFALASTTWARDADLADWRVLDLAKAFAVCGLAALLAVSMRALRAAVWTLLACGALLGLLAVVQAALGGKAQLGGLARIKMAHIYGDLFEPRIAGPLGDPNFFAQVLVILVPLSLFMGWDARTPSARVAAYACGALVTAATVVTYSRGGALALGCVIALALLARREHLRQAAAGVLVFFALWLLLPGDFTRRLGTIGQIVGEEEELRPDSSFQKRRLLTQVAGHMFLDHPVVGVGAANYTTRFDEVAERVSFASRDYEEPGDAHYPHNLYLEVAAETGLVGSALFAGALVAAFAALRRARFAFRARGETPASGLAAAFQIALAGYLVSSLFLHGSFPRYLWMLFGFAVALDLLSRREAAVAAEVHA